MNMAAATWVKCWKLWHINHWNAQSAMWCDTGSHPGGGGGYRLPQCSVPAKCVSVCVSQQKVWGVEVCLQSGKVCNAVWQRIIDSQSQSQMLLRKHKAFMPGHIPLCLSVRHDEPSVGMKWGDCDGTWAKDQEPSYHAKDLSFLGWFFCGGMWAYDVGSGGPLRPVQTQRRPLFSIRERCRGIV